MTRVRLVACLLGVCLAAGLFALGRATAGSHGAAPAAPAADGGYARGLVDGRVLGVQEGRAEQETRALPPAAKGGAKKTFDDGYQAGSNDVFAGYDGGWALSAPYVITLRRGRTGVTYAFASRTPFRPGVTYFLCPHSVRLCQEPRR